MRLKASVLLARYLAGDLTLVGELYGMRSLQEYLKQHCPEHPLAMFREAVSSETSHDARKRLLENELETADLESKLVIDAWQRPSKLTGAASKANLLEQRRAGETAPALHGRASRGRKRRHLGRVQTS